MNMKGLALTLFSLALISNLTDARTVPPCNVDSFAGILHQVGASDVASVVYATSISEGRSSFDPSPPFQSNITDLPELCAVKIEVQSSENSSYRFAVFLPASEDWNERTMVTGNGGFGGGINVRLDA
jgi:feruloyl esterase